MSPADWTPRERAIWERCRAEAAHRVGMILGEVIDQRADNLRASREAREPDRCDLLIAKRDALIHARDAIKAMLPGRIDEHGGYGPAKAETPGGGGVQSSVEATRAENAACAKVAASFAAKNNAGLCHSIAAAIRARVPTPDPSTSAETPSGAGDQAEALS